MPPVLAAMSTTVSTFLAVMVPHSNEGGDGGPNRPLTLPVCPFPHVYVPTPLDVEIEGLPEPQASQASAAPSASATAQPQQLAPLWEAGVDVEAGGATGQGVVSEAHSVQNLPMWIPVQQQP